MDIIETKDCIESLIKEIGKCRREIEDKGKAKAKAISDYDRKLAVTLATLRNSENYELAGQTYKVPPVTILDKIAKGLCADERYELEVADSGYRATLSNLQALLAQCNAFQSILRYFENI